MRNSALVFASGGGPRGGCASARGWQPGISRRAGAAGGEHRDRAGPQSPPVSRPSAAPVPAGHPRSGRPRGVPSPPSSSRSPRGSAHGQRPAMGRSVGFTGSQHCYIRPGRAPAPAVRPVPSCPTAAPGGRPAFPPGPPAGGSPGRAPPRGWGRLCPPGGLTGVLRPGTGSIGTGGSGTGVSRCPPAGLSLRLPRALGGQESVRGSRGSRRQLGVAQVLLVPALLPGAGPGGRAQVAGPWHRRRLQPCGTGGRSGRSGTGGHTAPGGPGAPLTARRLSRRVLLVGVGEDLGQLLV